MAYRAFSESQGETTARDERSGRSHATPGRTEDRADALTREGGVGRGPERIEDGFVADDAPPPPCQPTRRGVQHAANG